MSLLNTDGRSNAVVEVAQQFEIDHVTNPDARQIGMSFARLAQELILRMRREDTGLITTLEKLLDAREEAMVAVMPEPRKEQTRQAVARKPATRTRAKATTGSKEG